MPPPEMSLCARLWSRIRRMAVPEMACVAILLAATPFVLGVVVGQRMAPARTGYVSPDYYKQPGCYWLEAAVEVRPVPENVTVGYSTPIVYLREGPDRKVGEFGNAHWAKKFIEDWGLKECQPSP